MNRNGVALEGEAVRRPEILDARLCRGFERAEPLDLRRDPLPLAVCHIVLLQVDSNMNGDSGCNFLSSSNDAASQGAEAAGEDRAVTRAVCPPLPDSQRSSTMILNSACPSSLRASVLRSAQ